MVQAMSTARDIPILIKSTASSSERRITPSWSIAHLKTKLEPVTGIPPSSQKLTLRLPDQQQETPIEAEHEDGVEIGRWPLVAYAEIMVQAPLSPNGCGHFGYCTRSQLFSTWKLGIKIALCCMSLTLLGPSEFRLLHTLCVL